MTEIMLDQNIQTPQRPSWLARLTIADGVLGLVLVLTAVHHFTDLGKLPLSPQEAEAALAVWQWWQPGAMTTAVPSPAYFTLTTLLAPVLGFNDGVMRLVPALFGLGLVALPAFLRERLGTIGSLVMSIFLAVSPMSGIVARSAGGESIALFAVLLTAVAWIRFQDSAHQGWFHTLLIALALGLASAPLFYSGLFALALALGMQQAIGPWLREDGLTLWPQQLDRRQGWLMGLVVFLAISTLFLWNLGGLGSAAQLLASWITQLGIQTDVGLLLNPILLFGRYELLLFVLGTFLIAWAIWRNEGTAVFAAFWLTALFVLILLQPGHNQNAVLLTLPGYLLIAYLMNTLWQGHQEMVSYVLTGILIFLGILIWVNVARYGRIVTTAPDQLGYFWIALLALVLALTALYTVGSGWEVNIAWQGALCSLLFLFFFYQWGTSWWLSHEAANDPRERWVTLPATDDDLVVMNDILRQVSRQTINSDFDLALYSTIDTPLLRWYLRDYRRAQFGETIPPNVIYEAIISTNDQANLTLESDYIGSDFGLIQVSLEPRPGRSAFLDALRWWLFHESNTGVNSQQMIFWVRADLTGGSNPNP